MPLPLRPALSEAISVVSPSRASPNVSWKSKRSTCQGVTVLEVLMAAAPAILLLPTFCWQNVDVLISAIGMP